MRKKYVIEVVLPNVSRSEELTTAVLNEVRLEEKLRNALKSSGYPFVIQEAESGSSQKGFIDAFGVEHAIKMIHACNELKDELIRENNPKAEALSHLLMMVETDAIKDKEE